MQDSYGANGSPSGNDVFNPGSSLKLEEGDNPHCLAIDFETEANQQVDRGIPVALPTSELSVNLDGIPI